MRPKQTRLASKRWGSFLDPAYSRLWLTALFQTASKLSVTGRQKRGKLRITRILADRFVPIRALRRFLLPNRLWGWLVPFPRPSPGGRVSQQPPVLALCPLIPTRATAW